MLTTIIVILLILWLISMIGPGLNPNFPNGGNFVHLILVVILIIILLRVLGVNI